MRFRIITVPVFALFLISCTTNTNKTSSRESADTRFERLSEEFIRTHYDHRPLAAVSLGWLQYDGEFQIRDAQNIADEIARLRKCDTLFKDFRPPTLSAQHQLELHLTKS